MSQEQFIQIKIKEVREVNKKEVDSLISWYREMRGHELDYEELFFEPLLEAFGEDIDEILKFLNEMDIKDLEMISGCFEDIYGKFMTDEVYDALGELEEKISASHQ